LGGGGKFFFLQSTHPGFGRDVDQDRAGRRTAKHCNACFVRRWQQAHCRRQAIRSTFPPTAERPGPRPARRGTGSRVDSPATGRPRRGGDLEHHPGSTDARCHLEVLGQRGGMASHRILEHRREARRRAAGDFVYTSANSGPPEQTHLETWSARWEIGRPSSKRTDLRPRTVRVYTSAISERPGRPSSLARLWAVASSASREELAANLLCYDAVYVSTDFGRQAEDPRPEEEGVSCRPSPPPRDGQSMSPRREGHPFHIANGGTTWRPARPASAPRTGKRGFVADGSKLVAVVNDRRGRRFIYVSTNSVSNWTETRKDLGPQAWKPVASASDGTKLVAVADDDTSTLQHIRGAWVSAHRSRGWRAWLLGRRHPPGSRRPERLHLHVR